MKFIIIRFSNIGFTQSAPDLTSFCCLFPHLSFWRPLRPGRGRLPPPAAAPQRAAQSARTWLHEWSSVIGRTPLNSRESAGPHGAQCPPRSRAARHSTAANSGILTCLASQPAGATRRTFLTGNRAARIVRRAVPVGSRKLYGSAQIDLPRIDNYP